MMMMGNSNDEDDDDDVFIDCNLNSNAVAIDDNNTINTSPAAAAVPDNDNNDNTSSTDLWLESLTGNDDLNNNFNNNNNTSNNCYATTPNVVHNSVNNDNVGGIGQSVVDFKSSSDDLLFDPNYIEYHHHGANNNVDSVAYLKTTHVTGNGVSCELVS